MTIDTKASLKLLDAVNEAREVWGKTDVLVERLHEARRIVWEAEEAIKKAEAGEKVFHGLRLGELVEMLAPLEADACVMFDFCGCFPLPEVDSYRGYYEDLAIGWSEYEAGRFEPATVSQIYSTLSGAIGSTYGGWKGGEFTMRSDSRLWVSNPGSSSGVAIVGVTPAGKTVYLRTWKID